MFKSIKKALNGKKKSIANDDFNKKQIHLADKDFFKNFNYKMTEFVDYNFNLGTASDVLDQLTNITNFKKGVMFPSYSYSSLNIKNLLIVGSKLHVLTLKFNGLGKFDINLCYLFLYSRTSVESFGLCLDINGETPEILLKLDETRIKYKLNIRLLMNDIKTIEPLKKISSTRIEIFSFIKSIRISTKYFQQQKTIVQFVNLKRLVTKFKYFNDGIFMEVFYQKIKNHLMSEFVSIISQKTNEFELYIKY